MMSILLLVLGCAQIADNAIVPAEEEHAVQSGEYAVNPRGIRTPVIQSFTMQDEYLIIHDATKRLLSRSHKEGASRDYQAAAELLAEEYRRQVHEDLQRIEQDGVVEVYDIRLEHSLLDTEDGRSRNSTRHHNGVFLVQ